MLNKRSTAKNMSLQQEKKKCHGQKNESLKPIPFNILYKIKCVDAQIYPSMDPSVRINDTLKLDHIDTQFSKLPKQAQD